MPITQILLTAAAQGGGGGGGNTYNSWTVEWFNKGISPQIVGAPRIFAVNSYPNESIAFSSEGGDYAWVGGAPGYYTGVNSVDGSWQHWVMVSNGSYLGVYRNGTRLIYSARERMVNDSVSSLYVGISSDPSTGYKGYITNFRIVKGENMYDPNQSTITVPQVPLTSNSNTELLLKALNSGSTLTDSSSRVRTPWGQGGLAWSSESPFTAAGPYVGMSPVTGPNILYILKTSYPDIENVKSGWIVTSASYSARVAGIALDAPLYWVITLDTVIGEIDGQLATFTQPELGGSIEMYTNSVNYGYIGYTSGTQWALDVV